MKSQLTKKAIAKRQAAATHKLVIKNEYGQTTVVAMGFESDMQAILKITDRALEPKIVSM